MRNFKWSSQYIYIRNIYHVYDVPDSLSALYVLTHELLKQLYG